MRHLIGLLPLLTLACVGPEPGDEAWDPFAEADPSADWQSPPPPTITLSTPATLRVGAVNDLTVSGDLAPGERAYFGGTLAGQGSGPCIPAAGGLCLSLRNPVRLLGTAVADAQGDATLSLTIPGSIPLGTMISLQAIVVRSIGGIDSIATAPVTVEADDGPAEGDFLADWTLMDFTDNGYRDGCPGGAKYVKSTPYADADYVGVTVCGPGEYKIWLSDMLYGTFISAGDWSGSGEDQCEYVGGTFVSFPQGSTAVDPGQPCWSRGPLGADPAFEASCISNRWIAPVHQCTARIPPTGPAEGTVLTSWTAFDFFDNGYRDDCAGGAKYIRSLSYTDATYVGVTLCSPDTYKIWLSDSIYGQFISAGDWSGSGEDHCEYVGGTFGSFPFGSDAVDPGQPCWSRGPLGAEPAYEASCISNRWVPSGYMCGVSIP